MNIKVQFSGVLAEVTHQVFRHYRDIASFAGLAARLKDDYPELEHCNYRIIINNELISGEPTLNDGDEIILMPPFEGG
jgi:molybdopterin converting factor small subunit